MCVVPTHLLTSRQRHRIIKTNSLGHLKSWLDCNVPSESNSDPYVLKIEPIFHFSFGLEIFTSNATSLLKAPSLLSRKVMHYSEEWKTTRKKKTSYANLIWVGHTHLLFTDFKVWSQRHLSHVAPSLFSKHKIETSEVIMHIFQQHKADISLLTGKQMTGSGCQCDKCFFFKETLLLCLLSTIHSLYAFLFTSGINNFTAWKSHSGELDLSEQT